MGIEPTLSAWEAEVLPLNYTRAQQFSIFARFVAPVNAHVNHGAHVFGNRFSGMVWKF